MRVFGPIIVGSFIGIVMLVPVAVAFGVPYAAARKAVEWSERRRTEREEAEAKRLAAEAEREAMIAKAERKLEKRKARARR